MKFHKLDRTDRKWWKIILWWEIRRIPYNIIMYLVGLLSFCICFVTIPLVYLIIGVLLNIVYTLGWIVELIFINKKTSKNLKQNYPKYTFIIYLLSSAVFVLGYAILLII